MHTHTNAQTQPTKQKEIYLCTPLLACRLEKAREGYEVSACSARYSFSVSSHRGLRPFFSSSHPPPFWGKGSFWLVLWVSSHRGREAMAAAATRLVQLVATAFHIMADPSKISGRIQKRILSSRFFPSDPLVHKGLRTSLDRATCCGAKCSNT